MAYRQVRDILKDIRNVHRQLADFYESWDGRARDQRAAAVLTHVGRHEEFFKESLARYEPRAAEGILDTWIQYPPDETLNDALEEVGLSPEMSVDDVVEVVLRMDRALIEAYRQLADSTAAPRVKELFESLMELEETKNRSDAWSARDE
ncbi:MAG: hypothetical protein WD066_07710 [Planctomycetaceae bacterium]